MLLRKIILMLLVFTCFTNRLLALDVNKASQEELIQIKGIGTALANQIIAQRKVKNFTNWQDLIQRVKGLSDKKALVLSKAGLTVDSIGYKQKAVTKK